MVEPDVVTPTRRPIAGVLADALAAASRGSGRLVLLTGEAGIGKTTAARELASTARRQGATVRWAACSAGGGTVAHAPWLAVLAGLGAPGRRALDALLGSDDGEPTATAAARARAYQAVVDALEEAATDQPLLLVLDDLHWADEGTLALLDVVAGQLPALAVLVVGTVRDGEHTSGPTLAAMGGRADRIPLVGMDLGDATELLAASVGPGRASGLAPDALDVTGGNPFLLQQIGRLLAQDPAALAGAVLPPAARDVLRQRLHALGEPDRLVLVAAAVLGDAFAPAEVASLLGGESPDVAESLDRAARARLVGRTTGTSAWTFAHDLLRQAALLDADAERVNALQRRAAEVREAAGAEPAVVAAHLLAVHAEPPPDAATWCVRAGDRAVSALAWEEAASHYERALAAWQPATGEGARCDALAGLGRARLLAGDRDGAASAFDALAALARAAGDPVTLARAALGFSADLSGFEVRLFDQRQIDLLAEAAAGLAGTAETGLRAAVLARWSVALSLSATDERRRALAEEAVELARQAGDPLVIGRALAAWCDAVAGPDHVDERRQAATEILGLAESTGDGPLELLGRRLRFVADLEAGDLSAVLDDMAAFERRAEASGNPLYSWYGPLWRAQLAVVAGDLGSAEARIQEVEALGEAAGSHNAPMLAMVLRLSVAWQRGDAAGAVELFESMHDVAPDLLDYLSSLGGLAYAYALADRPARARELVDRAAALDAHRPRDDAEWLAEVVNLVRTSVLIDHPLLPDALAELEPHAELMAFEGIGAGLYGSVARFVALGCAHLGRHDDAIAHARRALERNRPFGGTLSADALRTLAVCLEAAGDTDAAELHEAADATYAEVGALHLVRTPTGDTAATAGRAAAGPEPNEIRRAGEVWHLRYAATDAVVKHSKGMADLCLLLARPGHEIHVAEIEGVGAPLLGHRGADALDGRAIAAYKDRLQELAEDIDDADAAHDLARAERARVEYDALVDALSGAVGLGGRARTAGVDPAERLRKAVSARIRDAIRRIDTAHPTLGRHLALAVRTGTYCSYQPETATVWQCQSRSGASGA